MVLNSDHTTFDIPHFFLLYPFYPKENMKITYNKEYVFSDVIEKHTYFYFDIADVLINDEVYKPWLDLENTIPILFAKWEQQKEMLSNLYNKRDKYLIKEPMIRSASWLLSAVFWINGKRVSSLIKWKEELSLVSIIPINFIERFDFILTKIDQFHCYIQVCELFEELKKQFYKAQMMNKKY